MNKLYKPREENKILEGVYKTRLDGLWYIEKKQFDDNRGFFAEIVDINKLTELSDEEFVIKQVNYSRSFNNVVRGMHAENWRKMIMVTNGTVFSALADVRPKSKTFGETVNFKLGEEGLNGSLFVLPGIANSICVIKGPLDYVYFVDKLYKDRDTSGDVAISLFDKDLNIDWPIKREEMIISDRDKNSVSLKDKFPGKFK